MDLSIGQKFYCFEDLEKAIEDFQHSEYVTLIKRDSRTIAAAAKKCPNKVFRKELKYSEIVYACFRSGTYRPNVKTGERPQQSTSKIGCPFAIKLRALDGQSLVVTHHGPNHNHPCTHEQFMHHPSQRRLDTTQTEMVAKMVNLKANKKLIKSHMEDITKKVIIMKDIHNISMKTSAKPQKPEMEELHNLTNSISVSMHVHHDEQNNVLGIFLQDEQMAVNFGKFPEVILVDSTYKLNTHNMPLYSMIIVDGNYQSHPVCFFLVVQEDEATVRAMIRIFKNCNPHWMQTKVVITDKDFAERAAFKREMEQVDMQICLFHVLRTFGREVTTSKCNINTEERARVLDTIQDMAYSSCEEDYNIGHEKLKDFGGIVFRYFEQHWHPIRHEWVEAFKATTFNFGIRTNNRIESFFHKVKSVVTSRTNLADLVHKLFSLVNLLRTERQHKRIVTEMKVSTTCVSNEDEKAYMELLTIEAFKIVKNELFKVETVNIVQNNIVECQKKTFIVEADRCTCPFNQRHYLPCRHIMALAQHLTQTTYVPEAAHRRWTKTYHQTSTPSAQAVLYQTSLASPNTCTEKPLTHNQKFKKASLATSMIASLMADLDNRSFHQRLEQMNQVLAFLQEGQDFVVCEVVHPQNTASPLPPTASPLPPSASPLPPSASTLPPSASPPPPTASPLPPTASPLPPTASPPPPTASELVLPGKKNRTRGRPKGAATTAIGLPRKRAKTRTVPFAKKDTKTKEKMLLDWYLTEDGRDKILRGLTGTAIDIESDAECIPSCVLDPMATVELIKHHFDNLGWKKLQQVRQDRITLPWLCKECGQDLADKESVGCDSCLSWTHMACIGMTAAPKTKYWFCKGCKQH